MSFNIAFTGVDRRSGAPIIQRSSTFTYNNDPNGTSDILYYFGSRLNSSSFINPSTTQFVNASRLNSGTIIGPGDNALDNSTLTNLFANSTDATDGLQIEFLVNSFNINSLQINSNTVSWVLEGSNDGIIWTNITLGSSENLGNNWNLITIPNTIFYTHYRLLHGEVGVSKDLIAVKLFGEYQNGDIAPSIDNEAQSLATHKDGPGVIYLPDAIVENFPENYYCTLLHFKQGEYTYGQFSGGTTVVNDNTNGILRQGEQLLAVFDEGNWELFKVGSGTDVGLKGALLTSNGSQASILNLGLNNQYLKVDTSSNEGLIWDTLNLDDISSPSNNFDLSGQKIINAGLPTSPNDYVTKAYADSIAAGFDPKQSCEIATTTNLVSETGLSWSASGNGIGKTLTSNGSTATIDGVSLVNGYRILVKDESPASNNGIYIVSGVNSTIVLTRATDFDELNEVTPGAFTFITEGTINISTGFILLGSGLITIDTTPLNFSQFVGSGALSLASLADVSITSPSAVDNNRLIGWNNGTGFFELFQSPGTDIGDLLILENVNGIAGLPPIDGTQISLNSTQVSPLNTTGDLWTYSNTDTKLSVGTDGQLLVAASGESTGLIWKTFSSTDFSIGATATDFTVNFNVTGLNTNIGPLIVKTALTPNNNDFLRWTGTEWDSINPTGTSIGDIVILEDVAGQPSLPNIDGSQLTNLNIQAGQGSPLTNKGDLYTFSTTNERLALGNEGTILSVDLTTDTGLSYNEVRNVLREEKSITTSPYIIQADDERQILVASSTNIVQLPDNLTAGFFTTIYNNQAQDIILGALGSAIIINNVTIRSNDIVILTLSNSNTWLVSKIEKQLLSNKGDILSYSDKPDILPVGTNGQVLVSNSANSIGFRWEDRADASDLIYTREVPFTTLDHSTNDIFEYIGRDKDISFANPFTNPNDSIRIISFTNSTSSSSNNIIALTDQVNSSAALQLLENEYGQWNFQTVSIQPYQIAVYIQPNPGTLDTNWDVEVSNNGSTWEVVGTLVGIGASINNWITTTLSTNGYFSYIRVINKNPEFTLTINEVKLFGWVKDNPQVGDIFAASAEGITNIPVGTNGQTIIANNLVPGGIEWQTPQISPTTTKGDISVHDGTGELRQPVGADSTVLIADSSQATGVRWDSVESIANTPFTSQRLDLTGPLQLTASNARYIYASAQGGSQDLILTDPPSINDFFYIVNRDGLNIIQVRETAVGGVVHIINDSAPIAQFHFDGTEWQIISMGTI